MVPFVPRDPMCPLFIELLIQRGRKSSTNPTEGSALAQVGQPGKLRLPRKSGGLCFSQLNTSLGMILILSLRDL